MAKFISNSCPELYSHSLSLRRVFERESINIRRRRCDNLIKNNNQIWLLLYIFDNLWGITNFPFSAKENWLKYLFFSLLVYVLCMDPLIRADSLGNYRLSRTPENLAMDTRMEWTMPTYFPIQHICMVRLDFWFVGICYGK